MLRSDAGQLALAVDGRAGQRGWSRRVLALVAGLAIVFGVGAVKATTASAFSMFVTCNIYMNNDTSSAMQTYSTDWHGNLATLPSVPVPPSGTQHFYAASLEPLANHCSMDLWWELQDASGGNAWSQGLETYVYDPNSGHNSTDMSDIGEFATRTQVVSVPQDEDQVENLTVTVTNSATPSGVRAENNPLSSAGTPPKRTSEPKHVSSSLHRADLAGEGWKQAKAYGDLGHLGQILSASKVPAACRANSNSRHSEAQPLKEGQSAFTRRGGKEFLGAGQGTYASARQASRAINEAVSTKSIGCLAGMLTSKRLHTTVSTTRLSVTVAGTKLILSRLKVSTHSGARITRTDYIDITGVQHNKANALMIFASDKPDTQSEVAAIGAVVGRLP